MLCLIAVVGIGAVGQFSRQTLGVILVIGLSKGIDAVSDVFYGLFQRYERMDLIAKATMLNGILSLLLLATGVLLTGRDLWGAVGYAIASALAPSLSVLSRVLYLCWGRSDMQRKGGTLRDVTEGWIAGGCPVDPFSG